MEDIAEVDITIINPNVSARGSVNPPADLDVFLDSNGSLFADSELWADAELWGI